MNGHPINKSFSTKFAQDYITLRDGPNLIKKYITLPYTHHRSSIDYVNSPPNLPGVYMIYDKHDLYIGEGLSLAKRVPVSCNDHGLFGGSVSYSISPTRPTKIADKELAKANTRKLEARVICIAHTTIYGHRLEERFGFRLINQNHIYLLPEAYWRGSSLTELWHLAAMISRFFLVAAGVPKHLAMLPVLDPALYRP